MLPERYVNISELKLFFKKSIRYFVHNSFNPPPKCLSDEISNFRNINQINPIVQQSNFVCANIVDVAQTTQLKFY